MRTHAIIVTSLNIMSRGGHMPEFVSLLSGLDSFVATNLYLESGSINGIALYFDVGLPRAELKTIKAMAEHLELELDVVALKPSRLDIGDDEPFYPFRNALFLTHAANIALADYDTNILITGLGTDSSYPLMGYPDTSIDFVSKLTVALNEGMGDDLKIQIVNPVHGWKRSQIFRWVRKHAKKFIKMSTSCYDATDKTMKQFSWGLGCGACDHCESRKTDWELSKLITPS